MKKGHDDLRCAKNAKKIRKSGPRSAQEAKMSPARPKPTLKSMTRKTKVQINDLYLPFPNWSAQADNPIKRWSVVPLKRQKPSTDQHIRCSRSRKMMKTKVEIKLIKSTDQKGGTDQDSPRKCEVQISTLQPESRGGLQITKIEKIKGTDQPKTV